MRKLLAKTKVNFLRVKRIAGYALKPILKWKKDGSVRACARYARYYKTLPIREKTILYESFFGRGMTCNPYALFRAMLKDPEYQGYTHVWVLDDFENHRVTMEEYPGKNVIFVKYQSREYLKWLASAKIVVNNVTFQGYYTKKENQIYINTWHGIPLKYLGRDLPDGATEIKNASRSFLQSDHILAANSFLTSIYLNSYHIKEIYSGTILEEGYPRNDLLHSEREYILDKLRRNGVKLEPNKKVILYAPTWRGNNFGKPQDTVEDIFAFREQLMAAIDTEQYQVLVKPHNALHELMRKHDDCDFVVPASFDANEMLSQTDILISDFSSIYFDFLTTRRPILFYIPDAEEYKQERGIYFGLEELPAPYTDDPAQIAEWINHIEAFQRDTRSQYEKVRDFCEHADDIDISAHVLDIVLRGVPPRKAVQTQTGKKRILILKGAPLRNGVGTSADNLLNRIDYVKYDVTLYMYSPTNQEQKNYINDINEKCRILLRVGTFSATLIEQIRLNFANEYCFSYAPIRAIMPDRVYAREVKRCFGDSIFDYVIDFDGYSRMMDMLALQIKAKKRFIWQHSDMENERLVRFPWLKHIFSLYPRFDGVVSCAEATMKVNRQNLATPQTYDKFTYATNLFNGARVQKLLTEAQYVTMDNRVYFMCESLKNVPCLIPLELEAPTARYKSVQFIKGETPGEDDLRGVFLSADKTWRNGIMEISFPSLGRSDKTVKFITVGRCSPEKNHISLIDGFELLLKEYPDAMLYIVGYGPNYKKEYDYVLKKRLENRIIMTGNLKNPFGLMQKCDCFILPSLHEGQPITILEARMLGLPIIVSNFSSVQSSLMENGQLVIGDKMEDIYRGMKSYIEGEVPHSYNFDVAQYNQKCYQQFEALLMDKYESGYSQRQNIATT